MLLRLKTKVKLETTSHLIFFLIEFFKKKVLIIFLWKPDHFPKAPLSFSDKRPSFYCLIHFYKRRKDESERKTSLLAYPKVLKTI